MCNWEPPEMTEQEVAELEAHVAALLREHLEIDDEDN